MNVNNTSRIPYKQFNELQEKSKNLKMRPSFEECKKLKELKNARFKELREKGKIRDISS